MMVALRSFELTCVKLKVHRPMGCLECRTPRGVSSSLLVISPPITRPFATLRAVMVVLGGCTIDQLHGECSTLSVEGVVPPVVELRLSASTVIPPTTPSSMMRDSILKIKPVGTSVTFCTLRRYWS
ncbi:MAG: hypothetical protein H6821_12160 [Planctomycetaceae bacterium]|nr:hypothetical protein [Planctomycetaceae bacterium]